MIEAPGHVVAPGFIDTHTHAEGALLVDPQNAMGVRQGITTLFLGIDGMSYAPLSPANYRMFRRWLGGLLGDPPEDLDMRSRRRLPAPLPPEGRGQHGLPGAAGHRAPRGGGFPRRAAPGRRSRAGPAPASSEGLEEGAVGFSTGSKYYPGPWADTEELVALCRVVADAGAVYMCEPRSANLERAHGGHGVREAVEVARRTGVRLHFAHYRTTPGTAGQLDRLMEFIDPARGDGLDVTFDVYPYPAGSSIPVSLLPSEAQEGGPDAILARLRDAGERRRIAEYLDRHGSLPMADVVFSYLPRYPELEGMSLAEVARRRDQGLGETLCQLLLDAELRIGHLGAPPQSLALWRQVSQDCMTLLARPDYMVCSDMTPAGSFPHPRSYGAFPRFLGRLRREFGGLTLEAMIQRMTDAPARRFGLPRRGRLERGHFADLVVFDPERVIDNATYDDPRRHPSGIPFVVVNGQLAVDQERCTGVLAGQAVP